MNILMDATREQTKPVHKELSLDFFCPWIHWGENQTELARVRQSLQK